MFEELTESFPEDEATNDLLDYFKATYVQGPTVRRRQRPPMFPLKMWNHYEDALNMSQKTTNCTEGWHNALHGLFLASHPGVWKMLNGIRKDMAIQRFIVLKNDTADGDRPKLQYQKLAERLQAKVQTYNTEENKLKYLRSIAYMT